MIAEYSLIGRDDHLIIYKAFIGYSFPSSAETNLKMCRNT